VFLNLYKSEEEIVNSAWEVLLAAAVDRNIVVFDSEADHMFSSRLIALMDSTQDDYPQYEGKKLPSTQGKIAQIYVDDTISCDLDDRLKSLNLLNRHLQRYYLDELDASLPNNKRRICICVDDSKSRHIYIKENTLEAGIIVLDNASVLLGAF
jgi:hypothetical protein